MEAQKGLFLILQIATRYSTPFVTTLHGRLDLPEYVPLFKEFKDAPFVSISNAQRKPLAWLNWQATVYHGLPEDLHKFYPEQGKYLAFLGRISPEKRPDRAIKIAEKFGMPLKIAAKVDKADEDYFKEVIKPMFPCKVKTSNAGHLLFSEVITPARAKILSSLFFEKHFFSGWGIRTVSSLEKRYNPLSYHNGSIWPHDNAIIAYGLSLYGFKNETIRILKSLFEASTFFKLHRIPELFCGFSRRANEGPTHYPVACHPQAWAAGSVFLLIQACLGLFFEENNIYLKHPVLPKFLEEVWIHNLKVKDGKVDLYFKKYGDDVIVHVINKEGDVRIFIEK